MIGSKRIIVVLPAYNAEKTLSQTYNEIPFNIVDDVILVDDCSSDLTVEIAHNLGIKHIIRHKKNLGYGGNQKSCYKKALEIEADIIVMLHPDYQYPPKLMESMCYLITNGIYDVVLASRILGKGALKGGMPIYKYLLNKVLTFIQNFLLSQKLSEYHTGYRAFSANVIKSIDIDKNSDDFVFDNQMIAQIIFKGYKIGEVSCPTRYFKDASSISFLRSIKYGFGVLITSLEFFLFKNKVIKSERFI